MGRKRRFDNGQVVRWKEGMHSLYGVVVDHEVGMSNTSFYTVVESDKYGKKWGRRKVMRSHVLNEVMTDEGNYRTRTGITSTYKKNTTNEDRACDCHCCVH